MTATPHTTKSGVRLPYSATAAGLRPARMAGDASGDACVHGGITGHSLALVRRGMRWLTFFGNGNGHGDGNGIRRLDGGE